MNLLHRWSRFHVSQLLLLQCCSIFGTHISVSHTERCVIVLKNFKQWPAYFPLTDIYPHICTRTLTYSYTHTRSREREHLHVYMTYATTENATTHTDTCTKTLRCSSHTRKPSDTHTHTYKRKSAHTHLFFQSSSSYTKKILKMAAKQFFDTNPMEVWNIFRRSQTTHRKKPIQNRETINWNCVNAFICKWKQYKFNV